MGPCRRRQPHGRLHLRAGGGATDGRGRSGQHHQHGLGRRRARDPGRAPYCATKAAVIALTKVLAVEWAQAGVRVNALGPGWVQTDLVRAAIDAGRLSEEDITRRTPIGRLAEPEEIADAALFLRPTARRTSRARRSSPTEASPRTEVGGERADRVRRGPRASTSPAGAPWSRVQGTGSASRSRRGSRAPAHRRPCSTWMRRRSSRRPHPDRAAWRHDPHRSGRRPRRCGERHGGGRPVCRRAGDLDVSSIAPRYPVGPIETMASSVVLDVLDVNVAGYARMVQAAIPLTAHGRGRVINLASITFFLGFPAGLGAYIASRGVLGLTRALARELGLGRDGQRDRAGRVPHASGGDHRGWSRRRPGPCRAGRSSAAGTSVTSRLRSCSSRAMRHRSSPDRPSSSTAAGSSTRRLTMGRSSASLGRRDILERVGDLRQWGGTRLVTLEEGAERGVRVVEALDDGRPRLRRRGRPGDGHRLVLAEARHAPVSRRPGSPVLVPRARGDGLPRSFAGGLIATCGLDHILFPQVDTTRMTTPAGARRATACMGASRPHPDPSPTRDDMGRRRGDDRRRGRRPPGRGARGEPRAPP